MRRLVVLLVLSLALVAAGCGGSTKTGGAQSHSVDQVSKAFFDAGLAFTSEVVSNRWVSGGMSSSHALKQTYGKYLVRFRATKGYGVSNIEASVRYFADGLGFEPRICP